MAQFSDDADIQLGSRTQSAETVARIAAGDGEYDVTVDVQTDFEQPAADPPPAEEQPAAEASTEIPEEEPAEEQAPPAPVETAPPAPKKLGKFGELKQKFREESARKDKELEDLKRQLAERSAQKPAETVDTKPPAADPKPPIVVPPTVAAKPDPNNAELYPDGIYDPKFVEDLADWKWLDNQRKDAQSKVEAEQQAKKQKELEAQSKAQSDAMAEQQEIEERWNSTCKEVRDAHPDFDDVLMLPPDQVPVTKAMAVVVRDQDNPAHVAYWLGKHPEEAKKIAGLTKLPDNASARLVRQALATAQREIDRIQVLMANEEPDPDDDNEEEETPETPAPQETPASRETRPGVQPGVQPPQKKTAPPPAAAPPAKKQTPKADPPPLVGGGRGSTTSRPLAELAKAERGSQAEKMLRDMSDDEYRRQMGMH